MYKRQDIGVNLLRRLSQQLRLRAGDAERVVIVPFPVQTAHLVPAAYGVAEGHAVGIAGDDEDVYKRQVGHRVVHGGEAFNKSVLITDEVMKALEDCIPCLLYTSRCV